MKLKKQLLSKVLLASLLTASALPTNLQASSIAFTEQYVISPRFSIKPHFDTGEGKDIISPKFSIKPAFNTGEGSTVVSPRFSIKPAFNAGSQKAFYSGIFSIIDMPDLIVNVDGVPLSEKVKVKDTSKLTLSMDFSQKLSKDDVKTVEWFFETITYTGEGDDRKEITNRSALTKVVDTTTPEGEADFKDDYLVDVQDLTGLTLETGKTYKIGQVTTLGDDLKYECVTIAFTINEKGLIEFISPTGDILYEEYITARYEISNKLDVKTYDLSILKKDGTKVLVGDDLAFTDTKVENNADNSGTIHEYKYKLDNTIKEFQHVINDIKKNDTSTTPPTEPQP